MIKTFTELYNFDGDFEAIDLDDEVKIKKITKQEKLILKKLFGNELTQTQSDQIDFFKYGIFYERENDDNKENQIIEQVYLSMRLFKNGIFDYSGLITLLPTESRGQFGQYKWGRVGKSYFLNETDKSKLIKLYIKIKTLKLNLNQPIFNRFKKVVQNSWPEESILDYIIIIESLFNDGATQEITYKLSTRVAYVLGQIFKDNRLDVFCNIHYSYSKIRSKIVHTGKINLCHDELMKYRTILEDYSRKLLSLYILNEQFFNKPKKLCPIIDNAINSNSSLDFLTIDF